MKIKVDPFIMICMWLSQFPDFYLKQYILNKNIYSILVTLMIMVRITSAQAMSVLDYVKENNVT